MLVRMVVVCFVALRYFLLVLIILIVGFAITFMLLAGALHGEPKQHDVAELTILDQNLPSVQELFGPHNGTFDVIDLQVALADTFGILLEGFDHADLFERGPLTFGAFVSYMLFGNIVMLNCVAHPTAYVAQMYSDYTPHNPCVCTCLDRRWASQY
jgi:hypothetical protein